MDFSVSGQMQNSEPDIIWLLRVFYLSHYTGHELTDLSPREGEDGEG